jgi:methylthioribulose-1-phosphate dehydratase
MGEVEAGVADSIVEAGRRMDTLGWVASVSGNISVRLGADRIAMTRSGGRKGFLTRADVIVVGLDGRPVVAGNVPSAETLLHCQLYASFAEVGAVLHGHSPAATVLSRLTAADAIAFEGYEMAKAFEGVDTHARRVTLPVFDNDQDIGRLRDRLAPVLAQDWPGYVLRGHGVYAWGLDLGHAMGKLEALEFLLACELARRQVG